MMKNHENPSYKSKNEVLNVPGSGAESDYDFIPRKLSEAETREEAEDTLARIVSTTEDYARPEAQRIGEDALAKMSFDDDTVVPFDADDIDTPSQQKAA